MDLKACAVALLFFSSPLPVLASGEAVNGFPKWEERVVHEWSNRARSDPQVEMTACGTPCAEHACYSPVPPLNYVPELNHSARFHADFIALGGTFQINSSCALKPDIGSSYPATCDGSPSCACVSPGVGSTTWNTRIQSFGGSPIGELLIAIGDPNQAFYQFLFEPVTNTSCPYQIGPPTNLHRWTILQTAAPAGEGIGVAQSGAPLNWDFGSATQPTKIVSGVQYPRQADPVSFWANWYDTDAPVRESVIIDGRRFPLKLARGTSTNGAWTVDVPGLGTGCHRYAFSFIDSAGVVQTYPTTGTYGVGDTTCPDYAVPVVITTPQSVAAGSTAVTASVPNHAGSSYAWTLTGGTITGGQGTSQILYNAAATPATRMLLSVIETPATGTPGAATTFVMSDFLDVPPSHPFHTFVLKTARNGVSAGCGGGNFCPNDSVTRAQMAVFLLTGKLGEGFQPPPATGVFTDVPPASFAAKYIEELYHEGITGGCQSDPLEYCPGVAVTRAQMAVFLLVAKHGTGYTPPPATGIFEDVPPGAFARNFIEELYNEGITGGCATNPLRFCPSSSTTRGQMSVFLSTAFALP